MLQAIAKARQAPQQGEVPVGALIVDPAGTILAVEHNQPITLSDPSAHAEIMPCVQPEPFWVITASKAAFSSLRLNLV